MAKKVITHLVDDIDGTELGVGKGETVSFALDGRSYEIDLSTKNAKGLRDVLARYIAVGRRVSGSRAAPRRSTRGTSDAGEIRAWAKRQGLEVPDRGRIPASIREQWESR